MGTADKTKVTKRSDVDRPLTFVEGDENYNQLINVIDDVDTIFGAVSYASGIVIKAAQQLVVYNDTYYQATASVVLPFTTTNWADDSNKFVSVGDAVLRGELNIIPRTFNTVAEMKADTTLASGSPITTLGYHSAGDGGQARYLIQTSAEYGGVPDEYGNHTLANGNVAVLQVEGAVNVKQFGAVGDGVADDTAAVIAARTVAYDEHRPLTAPKGSYLYDAIVTTVESDSTFRKGAYSDGIDIMSMFRGTKLAVLAETSDDPVMDTSKNRTGISITVAAKGAQHASGIRANLNNFSTDGKGCTAFYGNATTGTGSFWSAAVHGETRHADGISIGLSSEAGGYSTTGLLYGCVLHQVTNPALTHPLTGAAGDIPAVATGLLITGNASDDQKRGWRRSIHINNKAQRTDGDAIVVETTSQTGLWFTSLAHNAYADIRSQTTSKYGAAFDGTYTDAAVRLSNGKLSFKSDDGIKLGYESSTNTLSLGFNATTPFKVYGDNLIQTATIRPSVDDTYTLGTPSFRWSVVYAATGTINTSDERDKTELLDYEQAEKDAALEIKQHIRKFKFKDAVDKKGDKARIHFGVGAQTVQSILEKHGLDPFDYAFLCYDEWDELPELSEMVVQDDGTEEKIVTQEYREAGNRYGIRYDELAMFILGAI